MRYWKYAAFIALIVVQSAMYARAQDQNPPPPPAPEAATTTPPAPPGMRPGPMLFNGGDYGPGGLGGGRRFNLMFRPRMVKATFLGIAVAPADPTLRAQLKLPDGTGLAVINVDNDGPAKDVVQEHDVLIKLDDQLLINAEQLVVLVRMHKPGDTIALTVIRQAQPTTVSVKLVEHEVPELPSITQMRPPPFPGAMQFGPGERGQGPESPQSDDSDVRLIAPDEPGGP